MTKTIEVFDGVKISRLYGLDGVDTLLASNAFVLGGLRAAPDGIRSEISVVGFSFEEYASDSTVISARCDKVRADIEVSGLLALAGAFLAAAQFLQEKTGEGSKP